jgi:hypothetical protein
MAVLYIVSKAIISRVKGSFVVCESFLLILIFECLLVSPVYDYGL